MERATKGDCGLLLGLGNSDDKRICCEKCLVRLKELQCHFTLRFHAETQNPSIISERRSGRLPDAHKENRGFGRAHDGVARLGPAVDSGTVTRF